MTNSLPSAALSSELSDISSVQSPSPLLQAANFLTLPKNTTKTTPTLNNNIDGLLNGKHWASSNVTFSFTDRMGDYEFWYEDRSAHGDSFQSLNAKQKKAVRSWIGPSGQYASVTLLNPVELSGKSDDNATIRIAMSEVPETAFAYFPSRFSTEAGDAWFNPQDYNSPDIGNYAFHTFGHELGHTLGLKHGHETDGVRNVAMDPTRDSMEFSIMTYRSFVNQDLEKLPFYTNEKGGYAQSLMMYDIAALQQMYGASFDTNSTKTTYTFSATTGEMFVNGVGQGTPIANRIFRTVWDGNGADTYDFSNYSTNLAINLAPGGWSDLDVGGNFQRAALNKGSGGITRYARGHLFNALQYNNDARSLIENAKGGAGDDLIRGNDANNTLTGDRGNDSLRGDFGHDILDGGAGADRLIGSAGRDTLIGGTGNDLLSGGDGIDQFNFIAPNEQEDTITDFIGADDILGVSGNGFGGGLALGTLAANQFVLGKIAQDRSDRFIYNQATGDLFFDKDGTGSLGALQIVTFSSKPTLTHSDIQVI